LNSGQVINVEKGPPKIRYKTRQKKIYFKEGGE
jgi:hypothetical protein